MIDKALPEIPVFQSLDRWQIEELSSWLHKKEFKSGDEIFKENDTSNGLYVLARGGVEVVRGGGQGAIRIAELESPSVFGEMGLLTEESRSAGVRAKSDLTVGFLPLDLFEAKLAANNITALRIALNLGRIACTRLRSTTRKLTALAEALHVDLKQ